MNRSIPSELRTSTSNVPYRIEVQPFDPTDSASRLAQGLKVVVAMGICLLLAFEPLAFGGVQAWAVLILEVGAALLLMLWAIRGIAIHRLEITPNPLVAPMLLFALLVAAQLLPNRSAYWFATWQKALLWAAYGILFFLITQSFRRTAFLKGFGIAFTVFGFLLAMFAIAQEFAGNGKIYWFMPNPAGGWIYGPYLYHSHYAGLMEMLVPIPLVMAMAGFFPKPARMLFGLAALVMGSTIFLSQSLGGIIAFTAELVVMAILLTRRKNPGRQLALLVALCILLGLFLVSLRPSGLGDRLARLQDPMGQGAAGDRLAIVKDSVNMIRRHPLVGWGFGTFSVVYPEFSSSYSNFAVNAAHNDFVELVVETGLLGFALMIAFLVLLYRAGARGIEHWRRDPRACMALAALVGCTGLLVHSLSDFNMQVPANAMWFFALAAIASGSASLQNGRRANRG